VLTRRLLSKFYPYMAENKENKPAIVVQSKPKQLSEFKEKVVKGCG